MSKFSKIFLVLYAIFYFSLGFHIFKTDASYTGSIQGIVHKNYIDGVNINDTYELDFIFDSLSNTGLIFTGSLSTEEILSHINQNLQFQNDLLIFVFGFFIFFFSFIISFLIYSYFSKNYFFNKKT